MSKLKYLFTSLLFIAIIVAIFNKKELSVIFVNGLDDKINISLILNDKLVYKDSIESRHVLHQYAIVKPLFGKNKIRITCKEIGLNKEYSFFVIFKQWLVIGIYLDKESNMVNASFDNYFFRPSLP